LEAPVPPPPVAPRIQPAPALTPAQRYAKDGKMIFLGLQVQATSESITSMRAFGGSTAFRFVVGPGIAIQLSANASYVRFDYNGSFTSALAIGGGVGVGKVVPLSDRMALTPMVTAGLSYGNTLLNPSVVESSFSAGVRLPLTIFVTPQFFLEPSLGANALFRPNAFMFDMGVGSNIGLMF
jgi:hypothetical protein